MEGLVGGALAAVLEQGRESYNTRFKQARGAFPKLDTGRFALHLRDTLAPIIESVALHSPDRVAAVTDSLYELSLELVGRELLGPESHQPAIAAGWRELFPAVPGLLATSTDTMARAVTNALFNLSQHPGVQPGEWIGIMRTIGTRCSDLTSFLECGKVASWRCGLAHYRRSALDACETLNPEWARLALGITDDSRLELPSLLSRLRADPWFDPRKSTGTGDLRIVRTVGGFRGFGGPFLNPPTIVLARGHFIVSDSEASWIMHADAFGATLLRTENDGLRVPTLGAGDFDLDKRGRIVMGDRSGVFPDLASHSAWASDETTLAVTVPLSHEVFLVAVAT